jgi:uncharacterized cupredoxin-like copper-binding protein
MSVIRKRGRAVLGAAGLVASLVLVPAPVAAAAHDATVVTVTAGKPSELRFTLSKKTVPLGAVSFKFVNKGALPHDFKICTKGGTANACTGKGTRLLSPGASMTLLYTFKKKGTFEYLCTVPGHAAAGMKGDIKVT